MRGAQREKIYASPLYPCGRDKERPVRDAHLLAQIRDVPANTGRLATLLGRESGLDQPRLGHLSEGYDVAQTRNPDELGIHQ